MLYTFTAELRQTPLNADLQKLSSSALLPSCLVPRVSLHLYYIRTYKYYISSYGRDMVQNGLGFMHSVSLKSHGPILLSMKLLPYPVNQSCFPSALDKLNETALRRMVPAVTSLAN